MSDLGQKPELAWLPVDKLSVDRSYQRSIESRSSQRLIAKIAENFRWPRFGCVLAVNDGDGWQLIDGQHRTEGARRAGVTHVPAVILPHESGLEAAQDFIAINRDRVTMNAQAVYHAQLAAGDPDAEQVQRVCETAGIVIAKYPKAPAQMKPGETLAVGAVRKVVKRLGEDGAAELLTHIADATIGNAGDLRAPILEGCALVFDKGYPPSKIATVLSNGGVIDVLRMAPVRADSTMIGRVAAEIEARLQGGGAKERNCLSCGTSFVSAGPQNRMCNICRRRKS